MVKKKTKTSSTIKNIEPETPIEPIVPETKEEEVVAKAAGIKVPEETKTVVLEGFVAIKDINKQYREGDIVPAHVVNDWKKRTIDVTKLVK